MTSSSDDIQWAKLLTGQIHDMWFSVDDLCIDQESHALAIPLRLKPKAQPTMTLVIPDVRAVRVFDSERIVLYDINYAEVTGGGRVISIYGNIPIRVDVETEDPFAAHVERYP